MATSLRSSRRYSLKVDRETVDVSETGVGNAGEDDGASPSGQRGVAGREYIWEEGSVAASGE